MEREAKILIWTRLSNLCTAKVLEAFAAEKVTMTAEEIQLWEEVIAHRTSPEMQKQ